MTVRIVTDSAASLPKAVADALGIVVVPAYINLGTQSYRDGVDISNQAFLRAVKASATPPTTSVPSPHDFAAAYRQLIAQGAGQIVSIHFSGKLSGICNSARLGADTVPPGTVTVVDSQQVSIAEGLLVVKAAEAAQAGESAQAIGRLLDDRIERVYFYGVSYDLETLRRSGRVQLAQYVVGSLIGIKPVLRVHRGEPEVVARARSAGQAEARLIQLVAQLGPFEKLGLVYFEANERFENFQQRARPLLRQSDEVIVNEQPLTVSLNTGPGIAVGIITR